MASNSYSPKMLLLVFSLMSLETKVFYRKKKQIDLSISSCKKTYILLLVGVLFIDKRWEGTLHAEQLLIPFLLLLLPFCDFWYSESLCFSELLVIMFLAETPE